MRHSRENRFYTVVHPVRLGFPIPLCFVAVLAFVLAFITAMAGGASASPIASYAMADARARSAPFTATAPIKPLAEYLCSWTNNPMEKARAIYTWIAVNITYDAAALKSRRFPPMDARSVMKRRTAVCQGYAELFSELARLGGLEATLVAGWSKDVDGGTSKDPNHAWNAFKAGGAWHLADSTWGAGYLTETGFKADYSDAYFNPPPEAFSYSHHPRESRWQLLDKPIGRAEFNRRVPVSRPFLSYRITGLSLPYASVRADGRLTLGFNAPRDAKIMPVLLQGGRRMDAFYGLGVNRGGAATVTVEFPRPGLYTLMITIAGPGSNEYAMALKYGVDCIRGLGEGCGFPILTGAYDAKNATLGEPWTRTIPSGRNTPFSIDAPGAKAAAVIGTTANGSQAWHGLNRKGNRFSGTLSLHAGKAYLAAQYPGDERWVGLVEYAVK